MRTWLVCLLFGVFAAVPGEAGAAASCAAPYQGCLAACGNCASGAPLNPKECGSANSACFSNCYEKYKSCLPPLPQHAVEYQTDRPGGDYFNTTLGQDQQPNDCKAMCDADRKCKAWTYVDKGVQHPTNPRCWLKSSVPLAVANYHTTSGVKLGLH
jgi:hypothetical protein